MTKKLEGLSGHVAIAGFRNVKIKDVNELLETVRREAKQCQVQLFDAKVIASQEHLHFAALNALRAFEKKVNLSNSLAVEALLYASTQRQIKKAVDMLGIKPDSSQIAVLIMAEEEHVTADALDEVSGLIQGKRDDDVLKLTVKKSEDIKKIFRISDLEIKAGLRKADHERKALVDLVIEHMALLTTQR